MVPAGPQMEGVGRAVGTGRGDGLEGTPERAVVTWASDVDGWPGG